MIETAGGAIYLEVDRQQDGDDGRKKMSTLITLCRDIEESASADCIEDHEAVDAALIAPCTVRKDVCSLPAAGEHVGAEAESSATSRDEMAIQDCCDC